MNILLLNLLVLVFRVRLQKWIFYVFWVYILRLLFFLASFVELGLVEADWRVHFQAIRLEWIPLCLALEARLPFPFLKIVLNQLAQDLVSVVPRAGLEPPLL